VSGSSESGFSDATYPRGGEYTENKKTKEEMLMYIVLLIRALA